MENGICKAVSEIPIFEKQIEELSPSVIIDIGSGTADYLLKSAKSNPEKEYLAIDNGYNSKNNLKRTDNVHYIAADGNYLPLRNFCSDLTTTFGCYSDGHRMLEELYRITKENKTGIIGHLNEKMGIIPSNSLNRKKLKELANQAIRVGGEPGERHWQLIWPPTSEFMDTYKKIREMIDTPMEDILFMYGLKVIEKELYGTSWQNKEPTYHYMWRKSIQKNERPKPIVRTDLFGYLVDQLKQV